MRVLGLRHFDVQLMGGGSRQHLDVAQAASDSIRLLNVMAFWSSILRAPRTCDLCGSWWKRKVSLSTKATLQRWAPVRLNCHCHQLSAPEFPRSARRTIWSSLQRSKVSLKRKTLTGQNPGRHPSGIPQCPQRQGLDPCCRGNSWFHSG